MAYGLVSWLCGAQVFPLLPGNDLSKRVNISPLPVEKTVQASGSGKVHRVQPCHREHNNRRVPNEEQLNSKLHDFRQPCNDSQLVMRDRLQAGTQRRVGNVATLLGTHQTRLPAPDGSFNSSALNPGRVDCPRGLCMPRSDFVPFPILAKQVANWTRDHSDDIESTAQPMPIPDP